MSNCELKIVLDQPGGNYACGEKITGAVRITAKKDCDCRKLTVGLRWSAGGQGDWDSAVKEERTLFAGKWQASEQASYPFELTVPPGPLTYHGSLFSVDWFVSANADIRLGLDQKAEEKLVLVPAESQAEVSLGPEYESPGEPLEQILRMISGASLNIGRKVVVPVLLLIGLVKVWQMSMPFLRHARSVGLD